MNDIYFHGASKTIKLSKEIIKHTNKQLREEYPQKFEKEPKYHIFKW